MENKGPFTIKELNGVGPGRQIWGQFLVMESSQRRTKDGKEYYRLKLGDESGDIDAMAWDNCAISGTITSGAVVGILGDTGNYNGRLQLTVKRLKVLDEDPGKYMKKPDIDLNRLIQQLDEYIAQIQDDCIQRLVSRILSGPTRDAFIKSTAAKKIHHNYQGGLLEHTITVASLCLEAARFYPYLNRDLLISGALLHDVGKIKEFEMAGTFKYSTSGRLIGHIVMGNEMVGEAIKDLRQEGVDFPEELEWMIKHMMLSHHGALEFGSPVVPMFPEAGMLHFMDKLDSQMFIFRSKLNENEGDEKGFTPYDNFHQQYFFQYRYGDGSTEGGEQS